MIIRMLTSRYLGSEGIGLYSLLMPTFSLMIALSSLGFPVAISSLVASDKYNNKNIVFSVIPISLIINLIIILFLIISGHFLADNLLHDSRTYYGLVAIGFVLPFIGISSILRGYFFGKEKMFPHVVSNILEDVVRLILLILLLPYFLKKSLEYAIFFIIVSNIASEIVSIITFILFLPKNFVLHKSDIKPNKRNIKNVFDISIPTTSSRIIGNISYFFEPIILTAILLNIGLSNKYIVSEYGIISGFVLPLLLLPSFFTTAISQALVPVISKSYNCGNIKEVVRKLKQAIYFSLLIGIPCTIIFELFPSFILNFLYKTNEGILYTRILAPILLIQYIQSPLSSTLNATNNSKSALSSTIIGTIFKTISLIIFSYLYGIWGLIISIAISIIVVTYDQYRRLKKIIK